MTLALACSLASPLLGQMVAVDVEPIPGFPSVKLRELAPIDLLKSDGPLPALSNIRDFCLIDEQHLAILRSDASILIVTDSGQIVERLLLPRVRIPLGPLRIELGEYGFVECVGGNRLLLAPSSWYGDPGQYGAVLEIDLLTRRLNILALVPNAIWGLAFAADPSGELALLTRQEQDKAELRVLHPDGSPSWSRFWRICACRDICFSGDGDVVLLDGDQDSIQTFRLHGWWSTYSKLGLETQLQGRPDGISRTTERGFALSYWTSAGIRLVLTKPDFQVRRILRPRHTEGTPIECRVRFSPAGRIWMSDYHSLSRLGPDGLAELTLGETPASRKLREAHRLCIDRQDQIFALATRDDSLHEFDAEGRPLRVTPRPEGTVPMRSRDQFPPEFAAAVGRVERADCPSSDGSSLSLEGESRGESTFLVLRSAGGELRAQWRAPEMRSPIESWGIEGDVVAIATPNRVLLWHADGRPWLQAEIPLSCSHGGCGMMPTLCWRLHVARGGRELWLRRGPEATTIERYALP